MQRDIDMVVAKVRLCHPSLSVRQLGVAHPGVDDDGLWFFGLPGKTEDIQIESSTGNAPFIIEHDDMLTSAEAHQMASVEDAVRLISAYLSRIESA